MSQRTNIDLKTRLRMAANLRYLKETERLGSVGKMAKRLGISRVALYRYLKGERTIGMDVALAIHRALNVSLNWLVDEEPPPEYYNPLSFSDEERKPTPGTGQRQ